MTRRTALGRDLRYLSRRDVEAAAVDLAAVETAVARAFAAKASRRAEAPPKRALHPGPDSFYHVMPAALTDPPVAGVKWVGGAGGNAGRGLPHVNGLIIVNDLGTGVPVAVIDGTWITAVRTAAVTAIAARHLARPDSASLAVIGCGVQARSHLAALRRGFPLRQVLAYSRRRESAESFVRETKAMGIEAETMVEPRAAIAQADIVVTSVPAAGMTRPFLDPDWLAPGAFASLVDLGRSWDFTGVAAGHVRLDRLATDDHEQSAVVAAAGLLGYPGPFDADLGELVAGTKPGRETARERTAIIHPGLALGDLAVAALVLERAEAEGLGHVLLL